MQIVKCYWTKCCDEVVIKWHPRTDPNTFLFVCQHHFDVLDKVFEYEVIKGEHYSMLDKEVE